MYSGIGGVGSVAILSRRTSLNTPHTLALFVVHRLQSSTTMTTFTKVSDEETLIIHVDADRKLSKIDPMIYGGFTE